MYFGIWGLYDRAQLGPQDERLTPVCKPTVVQWLNTLGGRPEGVNEWLPGKDIISAFMADE